MDTRDLDALVRAFAPAVTRHRVLRLLAALPLAGVLAIVGTTLTHADRGDPEQGGSHRRKKRKRRHDPGGDKENRKGERKGNGKGKGRKQRPADTQPPQPPLPTRTLVTQAFTTDSLITIHGNSVASPYPSTIEVSGFRNGTITQVKVILTDFSHEFTEDVDILLAAEHIPDRNAIIMSDAARGTGVNSIDLVLDDAAANPLPRVGPLTSGTFQPTNYFQSTDSDSFPAPAPTPTGTSQLSTFAGQDPNGTWQLFVRDDAPFDIGSIASWGLEITAEVDA